VVVKKDERFKDLYTRHEGASLILRSLCEVTVVSVVADVIMTAACRWVSVAEHVTLF